MKTTEPLNVLLPAANLPANLRFAPIPLTASAAYRLFVAEECAIVCAATQAELDALLNGTLAKIKGGIIISVDMLDQAKILAKDYPDAMLLIPCPWRELWSGETVFTIDADGQRRAHQASEFLTDHQPKVVAVRVNGHWERQ